MDFVALDFETANPKHPPCAIGLVLVRNGEIVDEYHSLINPAQPFNRHCIAVHGITASDVKNAPLFSEMWPELKPYFSRYPVVGHNILFDKFVLEKAVRRSGLELLPLVYYDTLGLCRYNFPDANGFDLASACLAFGVPLMQHHNALDDARAAAQLMIALMENEGRAIFPAALGDAIDRCFDVEDPDNEVHEDATQPTQARGPEYATTTAEMDTVERIVFPGSTFVLTGTIGNYDRLELERLIESYGGNVTRSVSRRTTYVIVGLQDLTLVCDREGAKSRKILKAEELRSQGHNVKIVDAAVFVDVLQALPAPASV